MKKNVSITSLSARFYKRDGWTIELLIASCNKYKKMSPTVFELGDEAEYYIYHPGFLDYKALYDDGHIGELLGKDRWGELDGLSDLDILKDRLG